MCEKGTGLIFWQVDPPFLVDVIIVGSFPLPRSLV